MLDNLERKLFIEHEEHSRRYSPGILDYDEWFEKNTIYPSDEE